MSREAYKYMMHKYAGFFNAVKNFNELGTAVGLAATAVMAGTSIINKLNNDTRRKAIIEDLAKNDPLLRQVPKDKLISWYGVIYRYGPRTSLNKEVTKDLLHTFAKFGKVDMQTLKTLADTEKAMSGSDSNFSFGSSFGSAMR